MLINDLRDNLKDAIMSKDELNKNFLRTILSRITEYQVEQRKDKNICDDDTVIKIVGIYKNSLSNAIISFKKGGKSSGELITQYKQEILCCGKYLPQAVSEEELETQIRNKLSKLEVTEMSQAGKVIGIIIKSNPPGTVDGKRVRNIIQKILED